MTTTTGRPASTPVRPPVRALAPHPDRLLPADTGLRDLARSIYQQVSGAPIYSPHGHVDAAVLAENRPFGNPAELLITPDHYVTRLIHAYGVGLDQLGVNTPDADPREIWRLFCSHWHVFAGTVVRYWFESELSEVFGLTVQPSAETADDLYDQLSEQLARPDFRPRELFDRFNIAVLATTDDPASDLSAHQLLAADPDFTGTAVPTFRADRYMTPNVPGWKGFLEELAAAADIDTGSYAGLVEALRNRRAYFKQNGGTATDSGTADAYAIPLPDAEAERIHRAALGGSVAPDEVVAYRRNLLYQLAAMSAEDGLVMQLHADVVRNYDQASFAAYGPDTGHDLPGPATFTAGLRQVLNDFGRSDTFRIVLFTTDETSFSQQIAPLAGFYPSVYVGAPWWFIDTPAAISRFRAAATDSAGFGKTSGFIDDTRAYCSIPARHDMSRRLDAGFLAGLVATHQLGEDEAYEIAGDLAGSVPVNTFRLEKYVRS
ncbi:uronate isomerase [Microlunatus endophyticus]|uniref:Uronate isomerase n=1 Tax=Microlunatus endophyticus TaxID=1716077 RepID=A0A917SJC5_9ACTN|nr:glucuronate isomerase [Microlunatus endophyticus]GGL82971.1 uronate isomerase [Microlunatus endophyticus]